MLVLADAQKTQHCELVRGQLPAAVDMVARMTRERYPDLQIPSIAVGGISKLTA